MKLLGGPNRIQNRECIMSAKCFGSYFVSVSKILPIAVFSQATAFAILFRSGINAAMDSDLCGFCSSTNLPPSTTFVAGIVLR